MRESEDKEGDMIKEEAIEIIRRYECNTEHYEACEMAIQALSQEPCDDVVSRDAAIKAIRKSIEKYSGFMEMEQYTDEDAIEAINELPPIAPKPIECDDVVSRKPNCIDCIHKSVCFRLDMRVDSDYAEKCGDFLTELPSVTRQTGEWILLDECANSGYYCSRCQKKLIKEGWSDTVKKIKFCPNCGAKMVEPQESEDKE